MNKIVIAKIVVIATATVAINVGARIAIANLADKIYDK